MGLKAILFDVDDTLIDWGAFAGPWEAIESVHLHNVFDYICRDVYPLDNVEAFKTEYFRRTRDAWVEGRTTLRAPNIKRLLKDTLRAFNVPEDTIDIEACLEAYAWRAVKHTRIFPDVPQALTLFQDAGIRFGLVTNSYHPISLRDKELAEHDILHFFPECRICAADAGYLKPDQRIFEQALACLRVRADETVFVGDNIVADIAGAQSAGMLAVMRVGKEYSARRSVNVIPDATVTSLLEIPSLLDTWFEGWR